MFLLNVAKFHIVPVVCSKVLRIMSFSISIHCYCLQIAHMAHLRLALTPYAFVACFNISCLWFATVFLVDFLTSFQVAFGNLYGPWC